MQDVIKYVVDHGAAFAALGVAIGDFLVGIIPGIDGNNIFHAVLLFLKNVKNKISPPSA